MFQVLSYFDPFIKFLNVQLLDSEVAETEANVVLSSLLI